MGSVQLVKLSEWTMAGGPVVWGRGIGVGTGEGDRCGGGGQVGEGTEGPV